jgi:hypothetical protein
MHRQTVKSSNVASIGYDPGSQTLEVEFHHGGVYQYLSVPGEVSEGLFQASSHGRYFQAHIRDRFTYRRIT